MAVVTLVGCQSGENGGSSPAEGRNGEAPKAAAAAPDAKGRTTFVHCLDLIREDRFADALPVCRQALKENPGDLQIKRAIEIAEEETS